MQENRNLSAIEAKKRNWLLRVHAVQQKYREHKQEGLPEIFIYRRYIAPNFFISERTYREYLAVNVRRELKALGLDPGEILK